MTAPSTAGPNARTPLPWMASMALGVALVALALRLGTGVLDAGMMFDERWIVVPVTELIEQGWSVRTALDYVETKGPVMIWTYALLGALLGGELNDLRLVSAAFFAIGVIPLLLCARSAGLGRGATGLAALLYVLLPHHAVLGQLMMSEASFVCGGLWLTWLFLWGFGTSRGDERRVLGPALFGLLLALLLHHRIHAVAFAGAAALVALQRDGVRSWPWWVAGAVAGLSRVPLWIRWGGLVSPAYQSMHQAGIGLDAVTYLAAGLVPYTALFLWPALAAPAHRPQRWMIWAGAGLGLLLASLATPSLAETIRFDENDFMRFKGFVSTGVGRVTTSALLQGVLIGAMAVIGLASLGALASLCTRAPFDDRRAVAGRFALGTLLTGIGMYALTNGYVFDRYLLPWAALLPVVWVALLPRPALALQTLVLAAILVYQVNRWLA